MERKPVSPVEAAAEIRRQVKEGVATEGRFKAEVPSSVAACLLGLPSSVIEEKGIILFEDPEKTGVMVLVADRKEVAQAAIRAWRQSEDEEISLAYQKALYFSLYELVQACRVGRGREVAAGAAGLFLDDLAEEEESLKGLREVVLNQGVIPENDEKTIHQILHFLWESIPSAARADIASFSPDHLFSI